MKHWTDKYIGVPYEKKNCAQLVADVYSDVFDIDVVLPEIPQTLLSRSRVIDGEMLKYKRLNTPSEGCCVLMKSRGVASHIGVFTTIGVTGHVLHAMQNHGSSVLTPIAKMRFLGLKIEGFYDCLK